LSLLEKECLSYKSTLEELSKKRNSSPFDPQTAKDKMDELQVGPLRKAKHKPFI
jgi:hypothetical protein